MHTTQEKLLKVIDESNVKGLTLRQIGNLVGETLPQKIKHHLSQLERKGFIRIDTENKEIFRTEDHRQLDSLFINIPIVGTANCGPATIYADQNIEGYLKVSKRLLPKRKKLIALRATGHSMNRASIAGKSILPGDFAIIDSEAQAPQDNDYVLAIIDGLATIKKYKVDKPAHCIALVSESTKDYPPIIVHEDDNFAINGKVIEVIKNIN